MKKRITLFGIIISASVSVANGQTADYTRDKDLSRWVVDINLLGGGYIQNADIANTSGNYLNGVNVYTGKPDFRPGGTLGGDAQIGFFFGKNRHWGIGAGIMYLRNWGNVRLDSFHAEYQSADLNGNTFRQVVTANHVTERIISDNFNIPLLLKYKNRLSKHWGFTADAGALLNLQMRNEYKTNASFDYEGVYQFTNNTEGSNTPVYDPSPTPATSDFLITKSQYSKNNPDGNVNEYFNTKHSGGYSVGLGVSPNNRSGTVSYKTGSIGFLFQPSVNYFLSDAVALNIGGYYYLQPFNNSGYQGYTYTDKMGDYNSVLNTASHVQTQSFGGNIGVRVFLGKKAPALVISTEPKNPTLCGLCDGSIIIHGLEAGKPAAIKYQRDADSVTKTFSGTASADGTLILPALCAGTYSGIHAKAGKRAADGPQVTITDPPLTIASAQSTNPTMSGACDGRITLYGLYAGQHASVTYSLNNATQTTYETTVAADNSITLSGLCEGSYSGITVSINKCTANLTSPASIVLKGPAPPVVENTKSEKIDISTPVLFEFDKSLIRERFHPVLDEAYKELTENNGSLLRVDGHTDAIGGSTYNQKLSVRRAVAIKTYLEKKGIAPERIKTYGHGKSQPADTNKSAAGRSKNRRAVMQLMN